MSNIILCIKIIKEVKNEEKNTRIVSILLLFFFLFVQSTDVLAAAKEYIDIDVNINTNFLSDILGVIEKSEIPKTTKSQDKIDPSGKIKLDQLNEKEKYTQKTKQNKQLGNPVITSLTNEGMGCRFIKWSKIPGATEYELEIDGKIIKVDENNSYYHWGENDNIEHTYKVKAISGNQQSEWSNIVTSQPQNSSNIVSSSLVKNDESSKLAATQVATSTPIAFTLTGNFKNAGWLTQ